MELSLPGTLADLSSGSLEKRRMQVESPLEIVKEAKVFVTLDAGKKGFVAGMNGRSVKRLPALQHVDTPGKPPRALDSTSSYRSAPPTIENPVGHETRSSPSNAWPNPPQTAPSRMGSAGNAAMMLMPSQRPKSSDPRALCAKKPNRKLSHGFLSDPTESSPSFAPASESKTPNWAKWDAAPAKGLACLVEEAESNFVPKMLEPYSQERIRKSGKSSKEPKRRNSKNGSEKKTRRSSDASGCARSSDDDRRSHDIQQREESGKTNLRTNDDSIKKGHQDVTHGEDVTEKSARSPWMEFNEDSIRPELISMRSEDDLDQDMDASPVQHTREPRLLPGSCVSGSIESPDARKVYRGKRRTWIRGEMLGLGTLGMVFKAMDAETGETFAVKEVLIDSKLDADIKFSQSLQREIDMLQDLKHDHIVSYLGHDTIEEKLYIYLEYMVGGSIAHIVSNFGALDEVTIAAYTRDVLFGLHFLHSQDPPFLHRDIKGANILVGMDSKAKLSDFGCSKRVTDSMAHTMTGSIPWMAPEVMNDRGYGRKADIWSLGCLLIEMSSAHHPWESFDNNVVAMVRIAMSADIPKIPEHLSDICRDFILACLTRDQDERPAAHALLKHPFVTSSWENKADE